MGNVSGAPVDVSVPAVGLSLRLADVLAGDLPGQPMRYAKDAFRVYYANKEVSGANPQTFEELGGGYGKDAFRVFFEGNVVPGATPMNFQVLQGGYGKDAFRTFYRGRIEEAMRYAA